MPRMPPMELMLTIDPPPLADIGRTACFMPRNGPSANPLQAPNFEGRGARLWNLYDPQQETETGQSAFSFFSGDPEQIVTLGQSGRRPLNFLQNYFLTWTAFVQPPLPQFHP